MANETKALSLQECKKQYAINLGFKDWLDFEIHHFKTCDNDAQAYGELNNHLEKVAELYMTTNRDEAVKEALKGFDNKGPFCVYQPDNTTAMNCRHCGRPKWTHDLI